LVEPKVLFGWTVANQHRVLGARGKARVHRQRWVGSVRRFYRPSVDREPVHRGAADAKVGE